MEIAKFLFFKKKKNNEPHYYYISNLSVSAEAVIKKRCLASAAFTRTLEALKINDLRKRIRK